MIILPGTVRDAGESLSTRNKAENRRVLKILQNVKFLGRRGIAFRAHDDAESNLMQLFKLREVDSSGLSALLKRGIDRYLSPDIQNEMLQIMSLSILCSIVQKLHSDDAFTIMADECTDISNHEQLVICFRWVDSDIEVNKEFVGLYHIAYISADTIVQALKDCLVQMNLQWNRWRGQCYNIGTATNMAGHRNSVVAQILRWSPEHSSCTAMAIP